MILCDVNVLVQACAPKSPHHEFFHTTVQDLLGSGRRFGIYGPILSAVLRICTHPKIFKPPAAPQTVFPFLEKIRKNPQAVIIEPGPRHWSIFQDLILDQKLQGGDITDAWFAALALENDCEWWTSDSGFSRFPGLRTRQLLGGA
jgi:toxin-antitoxin system PIN domain toxin